MKAVVISDSHGFSSNIYYVLSREKDISTVIFLGDGMSDIEKAHQWFPEHNFICVKGNNDFHSAEDTVAYRHFEGTTVVITHGHYYNVRYSRRELISHAEGVMANLALYGHTHKAEDYTDEITGIRVVNPGALCDGRYAVIDFSKGGRVEVKLTRI